MDLIYDGVKYQLTAMQTAPGSFLLACNGSAVEAEIRSLADGGYLVLMGGKSHVAYMKVREGKRRGGVVGGCSNPHPPPHLQPRHHHSTISCLHIPPPHPPPTPHRRRPGACAWC